MQELTQYSRVVESVYDCALDVSQWPKALERTCQFVEGCQANLFYQDATNNAVSLFHSYGEDPYYRDLYVEKYCRLNPLFPASAFLEVGKVHSVGDVMPYDEFMASRLYKEWVQPQGILDALYVNLERSTAGAAALAIRRFAKDGHFDEAIKERFALLVPHVQRAVAIGKLLDFHKAKEAALSRTLDGLDAAVLLVASDGRLVYVNNAATEMLSAGAILHAPRGRLAARDPRADQELGDAIARAAGGDSTLGVRGIAVALAVNGTTSQVAHVLSLASGARRDLLHSEAAAALFVQRTTRNSPVPIEIVAQLYRLTASEIRVLAAVAEFSGVSTMARALGLSDETVRSHLRRIFGKTGVNRQADLVKLLAGHASPLRRDQACVLPIPPDRA